MNVVKQTETDYEQWLLFNMLLARWTTVGIVTAKKEKHRVTIPCKWSFEKAALFMRFSYAFHKNHNAFHENRNAFHENARKAQNKIMSF